MGVAGNLSNISLGNIVCIDPGSYRKSIVASLSIIFRIIRGEAGNLLSTWADILVALDESSSLQNFARCPFFKHLLQVFNLKH